MPDQNVTLLISPYAAAQPAKGAKQLSGSLSPDATAFHVLLGEPPHPGAADIPLPQTAGVNFAGLSPVPATPDGRSEINSFSRVISPGQTQVSNLPDAAVAGAPLDTSAALSSAAPDAGSALSGTTRDLGAALSGTTRDLGAALSGTTRDLGAALSGTTPDRGAALSGPTRDTGAIFTPAAPDTSTAISGATRNIGTVLTPAAPAPGLEGLAPAATPDSATDELLVKANSAPVTLQKPVSETPDTPLPKDIQPPAGNATRAQPTAIPTKPAAAAQPAGAPNITETASTPQPAAPAGNTQQPAIVVQPAAIDQQPVTADGQILPSVTTTKTQILQPAGVPNGDDPILPQPPTSRDLPTQAGDRQVIADTKPAEAPAPQHAAAGDPAKPPAVDPPIVLDQALTPKRAPGLAIDPDTPPLEQEKPVLAPVRNEPAAPAPVANGPKPEPAGDQAVLPNEKSPASPRAIRPELPIAAQTGSDKHLVDPRPDPKQVSANPTPVADKPQKPLAANQPKSAIPQTKPASAQAPSASQNPPPQILLQGLEPVSLRADGAVPVLPPAGTTPDNIAALSRLASSQHIQTAGRLPVNMIAVSIARQASADINRFQLRLDPPELGRVDVKLNMVPGGRVEAHLTVERPETLEFLQRDARQLERALNDAGLDTDQDSLSFSLKDRAPDGQHNENPAPGQNAENDKQAQSDPGNLPPGHYNAYVRASGVDIRV